MNRYIDTDKLKARLNASPAFQNMGQDGFFLKEVVLNILDGQPTADVVEVRHGYWRYNRGQAPNEKAYFCSLCASGECDYGKDKYCHNCGAKMDG